MQENEYAAADGLEFNRAICKKIAREQLRGRMLLPIIGIVLEFLMIAVLMRSKLFPSEISGLDLKNLMSLSEKELLLLRKKIWIFLGVNFILSSIFEGASVFLHEKMFHTKERIKFAEYIEGFSLWNKMIGAKLIQYFPMLCSLGISFLDLGALSVLPQVALLVFGIWWFYAYGQVSFAIAENPEITLKAAASLSHTITDCRKFSLFLLDLSFIGWAVLGNMTLYIGYLWLIPYRTMTRINAYHLLRRSAEQAEARKSAGTPAATGEPEE